jgi:hypothetical protein
VYRTNVPRADFPSAVLWIGNSAQTSFELFTLDPPRTGTGDPAPALQGWRILDSARISNDTGRSLLMRARSSVQSNPAGDTPGCFEPRHGLRLRRGIFWCEVVICFECGRMHVPDGAGPVLLGNAVVLAKDERAAFNAQARQHRLRVAPPLVGPVNRE